MPPTEPSVPLLCNACGYDLQALPAGTKCPECGGLPQRGVELPGLAIMGARVLLISLPLLMAEVTFSARTNGGGEGVALLLGILVDACQVATMLAAAGGLWLLAGSLSQQSKTVRRTALAVSALFLARIGLATGPVYPRRLPFGMLASPWWGWDSSMSISSLSGWLGRGVEIAFAAMVLLVCACWARSLSRHHESTWMIRAAIASAAAILIALTARIVWSQVNTPTPMPFPVGWKPPAIDTLTRTIGECLAPAMLLSLFAAWLAAAWLHARSLTGRSNS